MGHSPHGECPTGKLEQRPNGRCSNLPELELDEPTELSDNELLLGDFDFKSYKKKLSKTCEKYVEQILHYSEIENHFSVVILVLKIWTPKGPMADFEIWAIVTSRVFGSFAALEYHNKEAFYIFPFYYSKSATRSTIFVVVSIFMLKNPEPGRFDDNIHSLDDNNFFYVNIYEIYIKWMLHQISMQQLQYRRSKIFYLSEKVIK